MSFEKYICWNPEELSRVIHTEAEATQESLFLAIHTDSKIKVSISGTKAKNIAYQAFLENFLEGEHGNNVQAVIEGESGSGKSHLVQWMRFNIPQNEKRIVITIPKTQNNLYSVLKKLVAHLPNEEQIKYNEKLQRTESGLKNDTERINEFLSSLARTIEKDIPQGINQEEEEYLIPLLPKLFDDPYFRDKFFNNHPVINSIISLIFSESKRNRENREEFKKQNLPLNVKEATNASQSTQEVLEAIQDEELLKISLEIINRNLDKAITRTLSFSPDDLIALMSDIRFYFYRQNKELILLIEDFAQLQGVDTALLQVLTVEGSGELCQIRWAMAVTTGYFEKLEDTVRTRMTFKVNMDAPKDSDSYILKLGSRYLNAIRLGDENIKSWHKSYNTNPQITNHCDSCEYKKVCHNTFGMIDGIGLYPFNKMALLQMAKKVDVEKSEIFRPRIFINKVLKRNLNREMVQVLKDGQYPPKDLEEFSTTRLSSEEINKLENIDLKNSKRIEILLEIWSETTTLVNLDKNIHSAFSLPLLKNIGKEEKQIENYKVSNEIIKETEKPFIKHDINIEVIDKWGRGEEIKASTISKLRPIIYKSIIDYIDWDFVSVSKSMNIFSKPEHIYFEGQSTNHRGGFLFKIKQNTESAILLKAMYRIDKEKKIVDIESFANIQERVKKWSEYVVKEIENYYQPKENWNPTKASIELLILSSLANDEKLTINALLSENTNYSDMASSKLNILLGILSTTAKKNVLFDTFQKTYTGRKGGQKTTSFIDVQKVLPIIKELKNNGWRLKQEPSQEDRKEFKEVASLYSKWQDGFDEAVQDELIERYKWLDELENRIEIEDIGRKFKNQIKNLRELTASLGISGHQSSKLEDTLSCNLIQSKIAMETTKKFQEQTSLDIFNDFFPSRKDDALMFIKLVKFYEEMLVKVDNNLRQKVSELERQTGLSAINLEISDLMSKIDKSFKILIKKDDNAS